MSVKQEKLIGIVSYNIHSYHLNYGTALHTFAFQQYLKKRGVDSIVLDYVPRSLENYNMKYPIFNDMRIWHVRSFLENNLSWILGFRKNLIKYNKFELFFKKYYVKTKCKYNYSQLLKTKKIENYNVTTWVCESDVIWKLYTEGGFDEIFFLKAPFTKNKKKVAYSPSMGSRKFTKEEEIIFRELTKDYFAISCREKESSVYVSNLLNREVTWVLDPTLLLECEDYDKIAIDPLETHYLLVFNCMQNDKAMLKESQKLAEKLGLEMVEISNYEQNRLQFKHKVKTDVGIEEFLGYYKNADFIVCSSFHGWCFSIFYKKQFFLFQRDKSDYRMSSITAALGCSERLIPCDNKKIPIDFTPLDYNVIDKKLEAMRETSYKFIEDNIINS